MMNRLTTVWPTLRDCFTVLHGRDSTAWDEIKTGCPETLFLIHKEQPRTAFDQFGVVIHVERSLLGFPLLQSGEDLLCEDTFAQLGRLDEPARGRWHCRNIRCDRIESSLAAIRSWMCEGDPIGVTVAAVDIKQQADLLLKQVAPDQTPAERDGLAGTFLEVANVLSQLVATKDPSLVSTEVDRDYVRSLASSLKVSADELLSQVDEEDDDGPQ